jgi:hypothetical protein
VIYLPALTKATTVLFLAGAFFVNGALGLIQAPAEKQGMVFAQTVEEVYKSRQDRQTHPDGKFDKQGRWYPSEAEWVDECCRGIRSPSRAWPYSYMVHCRTKKHVENLLKKNGANR